MIEKEKVTKSLEKEVRIVDTNKNISDGQIKCPKCGATEITQNKKTSKLRCHFCRHEFDEEKFKKAENDLQNLTGRVIGKGASNIKSDTNDMVTLKCDSCAAEVVIDTNEAAQARCHWCRNTLSINKQIENGAIPDMLLPFKIQKEEAQKEIEKFVSERSFFAYPKFKEEFNLENVMGVYLPYMVVDLNLSAALSGNGEILIRKYRVRTRNSSVTYYDADAYKISRKFDLTVENLTIISNSAKINFSDSNKTNNIINAIKPFDTEESVQWNPNYLKGYASEKRDTDISQLEKTMTDKAKDITRFKANDTIKKYDRGVVWNIEDVNIKGEQWKAAYLPIWLYSYQQVKSDGKKVLHYVAANARTNKVMGSVPVHQPRLLFVSFIIEVIGFILMILTLGTIEEFALIFLIGGPVFYGAIYSKYRNKDARYEHETKTKSTMENLVSSDQLLERRKRMRNPNIRGMNNTKVSNSQTKIKW